MTDQKSDINASVEPRPIEASVPPSDERKDQSEGTNNQTAEAETAAELPAVGPLTAEEAAELRAKAREAEEHYDRYLRALADLENYRKRVAREREEADKYRHEPLLRELLPVLDGLDLAFATPVNSTDKSAEALKAGFVMIHQQLRTVLRGAGLEEIDALGKPFDPKLHEAIGHQESTEVPDGHVVQQLRKGFKYRDRLLRPASVLVARTPAA